MKGTNDTEPTKAGPPLTVEIYWLTFYYKRIAKFTLCRPMKLVPRVTPPSIYGEVPYNQQNR